MESFVVALNYAIPGFVILIAIEAIYAHFFAGVKLRNLDTISSLSSGLYLVKVISVSGKSIVKKLVIE